MNGGNQPRLIVVHFFIIFTALSNDTFAHLTDKRDIYFAQSAKFAGAVELQRAMIDVSFCLGTLVVRDCLPHQFSTHLIPF